MILLDTDHLSIVINQQASGYPALTQRMQESPDQHFATTVVSAEEECRGWLAQINRLRDVRQQVAAYERLAKLFSFFRSWEIVLLNARAAEEFTRLRKQRIRIGTQDLKIACIALAHDALLLSANLRHLQQVPGLRVENWLSAPRQQPEGREDDAPAP
jgi:tRNA(fMet)-specific endonuclease VapC